MHMNMHKLALTLAVAGLAAATARAQFAPRHLAVLRAGDNAGNAASDISPNGPHQSPTFVDEFDPANPIVVPSTDSRTNGPVFSVAIPTNDPVSVPPYSAMWFNGHAGSEGYLALSADNSTLAFSGYGGNILAVSGTPSGLNIPRGVCVIDVAGNTYIPYEGSDWYGLGVGPLTNPRGAVSDNGTNNFFGSGGADGNIWFQAGGGPPVVNANLSGTRAVKAINGFVYTSLEHGDGGLQYPAGIYDFSPINTSFQILPPVALPEGDFFVLNLAVPASPPYLNVEGFDLNPQGNIAYMADATYGIAKYVEVAGQWSLACVFAITNNTIPVQTSYPADYTGTFGLVVDWTGNNPIVYATTQEGINGYANSNRVVSINDSYNFSDGLVHSNDITVTTVVAAWSTNLTFHGLSWTPDRRPVITTNPASQSVLTGAPVTFTVAATTNFANTYSWYTNGTLDPSQTTTNSTLASATAGASYYVVVANQFGSVTSTTAILTVNSALTAPGLTSPVPALNVTNAVYDTITLPVTASGTTPMTYQWLQYTSVGGFVPLSDGGDFSGTATATLTIHTTSTADSGSYYVVLNNAAGTPSQNLVAGVTVVNPLPVIFTEPVGTSMASNGIGTLSVGAYPLNATYQWYYGATPTPGGAIQNVAGHWSGATGPTLTDLDAVGADAGSYSVVVTDAGGSVTSAVVTVTIVPLSPFSFLPYTAPGSVYAQNFDSLPDPGVTSTNSGTGAETTIGGTNYFVGETFDFAAPTVANGTQEGGGLNLPGMAGWFSSDSGANEIQATTGDNTTGLIVSFGCTNAATNAGFNPLYPTNNRALGIISSPATSGNTVFALRVRNLTGQSLTNLNLSYVSELWRNTLTTNAVTNYYYVDPFGNATTPTNNWTGGLTNLTFGTNLGRPAPGNALKIFGTNAPIAITNESFVNVPLATPCPQGGILWIVWEEPAPVSGGQGIGIDNLVFSSGPPALTIQAAGSSVAISWPQMFTAYTLQYNNTDISNPGGWQNYALQMPAVFEGINTVTVPIAGTQQYYFRLKGN